MAYMNNNQIMNVDVNYFAIDENYNPESANAQSGKAVAEAAEKKLDKMTDKTANIASGNMYPKFYAVDKVDGTVKDTLLKGSFEADGNTIAIRNSNGQLFGHNNEFDEKGNVIAVHKGILVNKPFLESRLAALEQDIPTESEILSLISNSFVPRKLTHKWIVANGTVTITRSTMYFCCCSDNSGDIQVVDESGVAVTDGEGDAIDTAKVFILIVPENTTTYNGVKGYMCFYVGVKEGGSILSSIDGGAGNIFVPSTDMEAGNRFIKTAGGMNVWTMPFDI